MRRVAICLLALLSCAGALPTRAQSPGLPPHAWLFGTWIGGLYPPPVTLSAEQCLALPVVIFTRDVAMRAVLTDVTYAQRQIETVRATATGAEFRFVAPVQPAAEGGTLFGPPGAAPGGRLRLRDGGRAACAAARREPDQLPALRGLPLSADPLSGPDTEARRRRPTNKTRKAPSAMPQTVARLLAESLEAHDVDQIFCVPGESYVGLTSAC